MTPEVLDTLGDAAIRAMARQMGLRGALVLRPALLRVGLRYALAAAADEATQAEALETGPPERPEGEHAPRAAAGPTGGASAAPGALPPALRTETMARVLERQGRLAEAAALRSVLRREAPETAAGDGADRDPASAEDATASPQRPTPSAAGAARPRVPLGSEGWDCTGRRLVLGWVDRPGEDLALRISVCEGSRVPGSPTVGAIVRSSGAERAVALAAGGTAPAPEPRLVVQWALYFPGGTHRSHRQPLREPLTSPDDEVVLPLPRSGDAVAAVAALHEVDPEAGIRRLLARAPVWERRLGDDTPE